MLNWTGSKKQTFAGYWNGERLPPADLLFRMSEILDCDPRWLLFGADEKTGAGVRDRRTANRGERRGESEAGDDLDLVAIHEIDLAYGMGGTYADMDVEAQVLYFPRTWLESISRTPPASLTFARGKGDSMQPTLQDGDIVLIDRSIRTIREQDAIWALTIGDIAMIKRVRIKGERVTILSDNDRVSPDEVHHEEINVVGRVVFIGRRI